MEPTSTVETSERGAHMPAPTTGKSNLAERAPGQGAIRALQLGKSWFGPSTGGLSRVYYGLMRHLPDAGVDVDGVVVDDGPRALYEGFPVCGVSSARAPLYRRWLDLRRTFTRAVDPGRYDVVASHFALYTLPVLDRLHPLPLVVHFHGPWAYESHIEGDMGWKVHVKKGIERLVYRRAARFIVLSEAFGALLAARYGVSPARIRVVPGGVDVDRFDVGGSRREARERLGWPTDRPVVLSVRRLVRRMGLENLVAAVAEVRRSVPDVLLMLAGRGPLAGSLATRVQEAGLQDHVRMLGFVPDDDLPSAYRAADVTVVPTVALEGFGLVTVESLAAGTPVLVTPAGGLPEVVHGLSERLVVPDAGVDALAAHLSDALTGALGLPSADACRSYARDRYGWPAVARQVRAVYDEAVS